jgi:hypothetical protein
MLVPNVDLCARQRDSSLDRVAIFRIPGAIQREADARAAWRRRNELKEVKRTSRKKNIHASRALIGVNVVDKIDFGLERQSGCVRRPTTQQFAMLLLLLVLLSRWSCSGENVTANEPVLRSSGPNRKIGRKMALEFARSHVTCA